MNKVKMLTAATALSLPLAAGADVIGGTIEVSYWQGGYDGDIVSRSDNETVSLENDLNYDDVGAVEFAASFEHPVPILPNIKVKRISLDETADSTVTFNFDGNNFSTDIKSELDLSHSDVILYYEVLDNWVNLDLGLGAKKFDGELRVEDAADTSVTEIDETIPMLYANAAFDLPFTGLSFGAELSAVSYSGDSITDAKLRLRQNISVAFVELGYRQFAIDIEDVSDIDVDADISGVYISTGLDF